jgi:hypoxanthine phosphoribosyltransferase
VVTAIGLDRDLYERDVVIIEDIVDTGKTLAEFLPQLAHQQPKSLQVCSLLHKKDATVHPVEIAYLGFEIPDLFVVGYGLDYNGYGRNLNRIMQISQ